MSTLLVPDWPAPPRVRALMSTRQTPAEALEAALPRGPRWLRQVHGTRVIDLDTAAGDLEGDAAISRSPGVVCAIRVADCMPILIADQAATVIGAAHAGWRGLSAGIIEATVSAMGAPASGLLAWLGPAIGPRVYEVGEEVREAFLGQDAAAATAFVPNRPGHWLLDLYAIARQRLTRLGLTRIFGGGLCTYSDSVRFHSYRRDRDTGRMAACLWLTAD